MKHLLVDDSRRLGDPYRMPHRTAPVSLGATLRSARISRGLSLRAAASGTGMSYSTLNRLENGERDSAPFDALLALSDKLDIPRATTARLAGSLAANSTREVAGTRAWRALRGGRLTPEATAALRRVHLADLLHEVAAETPGGAPDLEQLETLVGMRFTEGAGDPAFSADGTYTVPGQTNPNERVIQRAWRAHGLAHLIIANENDERPNCHPRAPQLESEREATYLAGLILIPTAGLVANRRLSPVGALLSGDEVGAILDEIMSDFDALATLAAARLAEESLMVELPL